MVRSYIQLGWLEEGMPLLFHQYTFPSYSLLTRQNRHNNNQNNNNTNNSNSSNVNNKDISSFAADIYQLVYPNMCMSIAKSPTSLKEFFGNDETTLNIETEEERQNRLWQGSIVVYASPTIRDTELEKCENKYKRIILICIFVQLCFILLVFAGICELGYVYKCISFSNYMSAPDAYIISYIRNMELVGYICINFVCIMGLIFSSSNVFYLHSAFTLALSFIYFLTSLSNAVDLIIIILSLIIRYFELKLAYNLVPHAFSILSR